MYDEILSSIDNIDECVMEAELNVISAMINEYDKAIMIMENYNGNDYSSFDIFQEGFKDEVNKPISGTKDEKIIKRILMAIPRLIATLVRKLINAFSNIKSTKILRNLKKAVNEYGVKRRRKKYNLPVKHDTIYNPNPKDQDIPDHQVKQIKEHINVEEGWIKSYIMVKKGKTNKEDYTFENYIEIVRKLLQNYANYIDKYNHDKNYSMYTLCEDLTGYYERRDKDFSEPFNYNGNAKMAFYQFQQGYYEDYMNHNYTFKSKQGNYKYIDKKGHEWAIKHKDDKSEKISFSEFLSRYEKIVSECNELTKMAIEVSKQLDAMIANSKYKDDVDYNISINYGNGINRSNDRQYFKQNYDSMGIYDRYNQVHKKKNGKTDDSDENSIWLNHFQHIISQLSYSINPLLDGKKYLDKEAELVTQALNEYNKQ